MVRLAARRCAFWRARFSRFFCALASASLMAAGARGGPDLLQPGILLCAQCGRVVGVVEDQAFDGMALRPVQQLGSQRVRAVKAQRARARQLEPGEDTREESGTEVEFLVGTFERALDELDQRRQQPTDDISLLEQTLAPSLESGFMLLDIEGLVLAVNQLGADLLGIGRPEEPAREAALRTHDASKVLLADQSMLLLRPWAIRCSSFCDFWTTHSDIKKQGFFDTTPNPLKTQKIDPACRNE